MASTVPAKLKTADITRFAHRSSQLETAKPAIAYWCEYWIINQILSKGLHNADAECLEYTTTLMDKLEQTKAKYASDDAIVDETAGQACVEQFGLETFSRADRAVQANKVTRQTADTFQAASTFLELLQIWGNLDPEIHAKIKYAKWSAVRIARAIKEGKDPNESNPEPEPSVEESLPTLDPNDPEVQIFKGQSGSRQASVEDVPDEQDNIESRLAAQSSNDRSLHPSAQPSADRSARATPSLPSQPDALGTYDKAATSHDNEVSPIEASPSERNGSVGGGYFPEVPTFTSENYDANIKTAPPPGVNDPPTLDLPDPSSLPPPGTSQFGGSNDPPIVTPTAQDPSAPFSLPPPPQDYYQQAPTPTQTGKTFHPPQPRHYVPKAVPAPLTSAAPAPVQDSRPPTYNTDDESIAKAQKHARWAISALNFEDSDTAVKELRAALQTLGAQ